MFNLPDLWARIERAGLGHKPFAQFTREEIEKLCESVLSSVDSSKVPVHGWDVPRFDRHGGLVIPFTAHPKYHWWKADSQSLIDTLAEMDATWEQAAPYIRGLETMRSEEEWEEYKRNRCATE